MHFLTSSLLSRQHCKQYFLIACFLVNLSSVLFFLFSIYAPVFKIDFEVRKPHFFRVSFLFVFFLGIKCRVTFFALKKLCFFYSLSVPSLYLYSGQLLNSQFFTSFLLYPLQSKHFIFIASFLVNLFLSSMFYTSLNGFVQVTTILSISFCFSSANACSNALM